MQTTYSEKLRDPRWQRKRLEIMERDRFKCRLCGDESSTLNVHHLKYRKGRDPWDYNENYLVTTCETCHERMHLLDPGALFVRSLIVGGASFDAIDGVASQFWSFFEDGSVPGRWTPDQWLALRFGIWDLLCAIGRDDLNSADLSKALDQCAKAKHEAV